MHTLLGDMLMCLIYVINDFHCLWYMYIHTETNEIPAKKKKNMKVI
jgi:hypothetical protein